MIDHFVLSSNTAPQNAVHGTCHLIGVHKYPLEAPVKPDSSFILCFESNLSIQQFLNDQGILHLFNPYYYFMVGAPVILLQSGVEASVLYSYLQAFGFTGVIAILLKEAYPAAGVYPENRLGEVQTSTDLSFWDADFIITNGTSRCNEFLTMVVEEIGKNADLAKLKKTTYELQQHLIQLREQLRWQRQQANNHESYLNLIRNEYYNDLKWYKDEIVKIQGWYRSEYGHLPGLYVRLGKLFKLLKWK